MFREWLEVLYNFLDLNGILILSLHDISLISNSSKKEFVFFEKNEDMILDKVKDSIQDSKKYGTSYLSEDKFKSLLMESIGKSKYKRYKKSIVGNARCLCFKKLTL